MKKIFYIITFLTLTFCKVQVPANAPIISMNSTNVNSFSLANTGAYFKDTDNKFDQWVGTWQYTNGSTVFKIVIQKVQGQFIPKGKMNVPINCYMDLLVGGYYYEENGVVKTNQLSYSNYIYPPLRCSGIYQTPNDIFIQYKEIEKAPNLTGHFVDFTLLPGSTTQATWVFDSTKKRNYSVPDNVVLTKL